MVIPEINVEKISRVFTFGCSFTRYPWPTWADMIIVDFQSKNKTGKNYGSCGAGNYYIFFKIMEAIKKEKINQNDLVIVCWSSITREDRYFNERWNLAGSVYSQDIYDDTFVEKYCTYEHFLMRDLTLISSARETINNYTNNYLDFGIVDNFNYEFHKEMINLNDLEVKNFIDVYENTLKEQLPSMDGVLAKIRPNDQYRGAKVYYGGSDDLGTQDDDHPTPNEHHYFCKEVLLPILGDKFSNETHLFIREWVNTIDNDYGLINLSELMWNDGG